MCVPVYVHTSVYAYVHTLAFLCKSICVHICMHKSVCMSLSVNLYVHVSMLVCLFACICFCAHAQACLVQEFLHGIVSSGDKSLFLSAIPLTFCLLKLYFHFPVCYISLCLLCAYVSLKGGTA